MAINIELENLYFSDKKERSTLKEGDEKQLKDLKVNDKKRLKRVKEMLTQIDTSEIWNCHYLALLFQHGTTTLDFETAHKYAKMAVDMGSNVSKWLYAATLDRWLVSQGKLQKYGTQFRQVEGKWEQLAVDGTITDKERSKYGVPTLSEALKKFTEKSE